MKLRALRFMPKVIRDRMLRSKAIVDEEALSPIELVVAETLPDIEGAARLLHDAYVGRGISPRHPTGLRVTPHLLLPSTITVVARHGDRTIGTLSVIVDSIMGPPMEAVFASEIAALRAEGRRLVELGGLAVDKAHRKTGLTVALYRMALEIAQRLNADDFVFAVHPDAEHVYTNMFLAERLGPILRYPGLNASALAAAIRVDLRQVRARMHRAFAEMGETMASPYHVFFGRPFAQIRIPSGDGSLERVHRARAHAAALLLMRWPDVLDAFDAESRAALVAALLPFQVRPTRRPDPRAAPSRWNGDLLGEAGWGALEALATAG